MEVSFVHSASTTDVFYTRQLSRKTETWWALIVCVDAECALVIAQLEAADADLSTAARSSSARHAKRLHVESFDALLTRTFELRHPLVRGSVRSVHHIQSERRLSPIRADVLPHQLMLA